MVTWAMEALTRLWTWEDLMHAFGVTPRLAAMTAPGKASVARKLASSFRAESDKVVRLADLDLCVRVPRAAETQGFAN
jgi:hypothetical protein